MRWLLKVLNCVSRVRGDSLLAGFFDTHMIVDAVSEEVALLEVQ